MSSEVAIKVEGIYKTFKLPHEKHTGVKQMLVNVFKKRSGYENQHVLKNISFEIKKGEFYGIVGRNGSGKSTLLKILAGIYTPNKGRIDINGSLTPFIELGVGFNPELTGRENVYLNGAMLGFSRREVDAMYQDIVDFAEIERFMDQKLKNYSSGMQVRLAFSIAIQADTEILILDEVLAVGDAAFQQKCFDYFEKLKRDKKTIVFVTHDMSAVQRFCTKALIIENGEIKAMGSPEKVAAIYTEDNLPKSEKDVKTGTASNSIKATVDDKVADKNITLTFDFKTNATTNTYIGFSLIKDGFTVGEMNSKNHASNKKKAKLEFKLDVESLNPGIYEVSASLFNAETKAPLAYTHTRPKFIIEGYDETRGGGIKFNDAWSA
jgi:ABC-2 type transport system ATP-binding protein